MVDEPTRLAVDAPAGEGAGRRLDVGFAIVAFAQGEELEQLAGEIFVGLPRHRSPAVEIDQHGGIAGDRLQERRIVSQGLTPKQRVLSEQRRRVAHLHERRGEMAMPEQGHALDQRLVGRNHLLDPPVLELSALLLDRPDDTQIFAVDPFLALGLRRSLATLDLCRAEADPVRRRRHRLPARVGEQTIDRGRIVESLEGVDFGRRRAERGSRQKVPSLVEAHRLGRPGGTRGPQTRGEPHRQGGTAPHEAATAKACTHDSPPIAAVAAGLPPADGAAAVAERPDRPKVPAGVRAARAGARAGAPSRCAAFPSAARPAGD